MNCRQFVRGFVSAAAFGSAAIAAYVRVIRPWHLAWGTGGDETRRPLPGDDLIPHPRIDATHAITIRASAQEVWPWLVQMGQGRGGMYSYDWLENSMGLAMHNADRILPEFQNLQVGDTIPFAPGGFGPQVAILEPNRALVLSGRSNAESEGPFKLDDPTPGAFFAASWLFYLEPKGPGITRLIERFRLDWSPASFKNSLYMYGMLESSAFVMERKMLLNLKERAERA